MPLLGYTGIGLPSQQHPEIQSTQVQSVREGFPPSVLGEASLVTVADGALQNDTQQEGP